MNNKGGSRSLGSRLVATTQELGPVIYSLKSCNNKTLHSSFLLARSELLALHWTSFDTTHKATNKNINVLISQNYRRRHHYISNIKQLIMMTSTTTISVDTENFTIDTTPNKPNESNEIITADNQKKQYLAVGLTFTTTQLVSIFFFMISALPYFIDFKSRGDDLYTKFDGLEYTIWVLIHAAASTFVLFLGPIQVLYGVLRKARSAIHKTLGYMYISTMLISLLTSIPLIVLRISDGGLWIGIPLIFLTLYEIVTLYIGISAVIEGDKPKHRRYLFRNYCGVSVFVTFRIGILIGGGDGPLPLVFQILTWILAEYILWKYPETFEDKKNGAVTDYDDEDANTLTAGSV
jgi:uncharacterized membrane protein